MSVCILPLELVANEDIQTKNMYHIFNFVCFYLRIFKQQIKDKGFVTSWLQATPKSIVFLTAPKALSINIYRSLIIIIIII